MLSRRDILKFSASSPDMKLWMVTLLLTIGNTVGHAQDEVSDM